MLMVFLKFPFEPLRIVPMLMYFRLHLLRYHQCMLVRLLYRYPSIYLQLFELEHMRKRFVLIMLYHQL